jgi:hypothetical protein
MRNIILILLAVFMPTYSWAQSATFLQATAQPTYPPSITIKATPGSGYTHVEYQVLRNGYWTGIATQQGQSVVNLLVTSNGAYKLRVRGVTPSPYKAGDWKEHDEGFRFNIIAGEGTPPAVGPLCVQKTVTDKVKISLNVSCVSAGCGESFGRACYSAGGSVSGSACYKNVTTVYTCT